MSPLEKLFADLPRIPSIPRVVQDLIASLVKEDVDLATLVEQVKHDQSLALRVLALANSSAFGVSKRIGAIDQAVTLIGLSALRTLVIASGISRAFADVPGLDMPRFWQQSMVCAGVARQFGKRQGVNREFAYSAGLMNRVGIILLLQVFPTEQALAEALLALPVQAQVVQERELYGLDHCEAGAELARQWNFPQTIQNALRWSCDPLAEGADTLAAVLNIAETVSNCLLAGEHPEKISVLLEPSVLARLSMNRVDALRRIEACLDIPESVRAMI